MSVLFTLRHCKVHARLQGTGPWEEEEEEEEEEVNDLRGIVAKFGARGICQDWGSGLKGQGGIFGLLLPDLR